MPAYTFADGNVPSSSQLNSNVRDQVVTTCTAATRPTGTAGQMIYETDTGKIRVFDGSTWVENNITGAGNTWSPTVTQSSAITTTVTYGRYWQQLNLVTCFCVLSLTSAGVANNAIEVSVPVTAVAVMHMAGGARFIDSSASTGWPALPYLVSTTKIRLIDCTAGTGVYLGQTGASFAVAIGSGDSIYISASYPAG